MHTEVWVTGRWFWTLVVHDPHSFSAGRCLHLKRSQRKRWWWAWNLILHNTLVVPWNWGNHNLRKSVSLHLYFPEECLTTKPSALSTTPVKCKSQGTRKRVLSESLTIVLQKVVLADSFLKCSWKMRWFNEAWNLSFPFLFLSLRTWLLLHLIFGSGGNRCFADQARAVLGTCRAATEVALGTFQADQDSPNEF